VVNKEKTEWVALSDEAVSFRSDTLVMKLKVDSMILYVNNRATTGGHLALDMRRSYNSDNEEFQKDLVRNDMKIVKSVNAQCLADIKKPFTIDYGFAMPFETVSDKILIHPFPDLVISENELKMNFRSYPVDMIYSKTNTFHTILEIPPGYKLSEAINELNIDNALVKINYKVTQSEDKLIIDGVYSFKKAIYMPHEYYDLRKMYSTIIDTFNRKIILQKAA
jgi:hypothetical protein